MQVPLLQNCGDVQTLPHCPQLLLSLLPFFSQPSIEFMFAVEVAGVAGAHAHMPVVHLADALA